MPTTYSEHSSGLLIAQAGADEAAVSRALWEYDRNLKLRSAVDSTGRTFWSVRAYIGSEMPDRFVCVWMDEQTGEPLPLSMNLLEKVKQLDPNTRSVYLDEDTLNAHAKASVAASKQAEIDGMAAEYAKRDGRHPMLHRSPGLVMARRRERRRGKKI